MKSNAFKMPASETWQQRKFLLGVKLTGILLIMAFTQSNARGNSQTVNFSKINYLLKPSVQITITGRVVDSSNMPLPGITVKVKGGEASTSTDKSGKFKINVPGNNSVLVFSSIGFITKEMPVSVDGEMSITLISNQNNLNEVVVVGYGQQKKADLTSAISTVSPKDLGNITYSNVGQALQGRAPGLFIRDAGYDQGLSFLVRGQTTIGDNTPLFIVDGIPYSANNVDPNNIASISILKDASATAIYGARAAAGVVLITTKTGSKDKTTINYDGYYSWENPTVLPQSANSLQSAELMNEAAANSGASPLFTSDQINLFKTGNNPGYANTDWTNLLIKTQHRNKQYLSVNGGNENTQYFVAASYMNSDGILAKTVSDDQYNIQFNLATKLRKNIDLKFNVSLNRDDSTRPSINGGIDNIYQHALVIAPFLPLKNPDGTYAFFNSAGSYSRGFWNPLWELNAGSAVTQVDMTVVNGELTWELFKGLKYIGRAAITTNNGQGTSNLYGSDYTGGPSFVSNIPSLTKSTTYTQQLNAQNFLQYDKKFGDHSLTVLGGWDVEFDKSSYFDASRQNFLFNNILTELSAPNSGDPTDITDLESNTTQNVLQSAVGRINYNFKSKYFLEASARYDGSSIFAPATRYGFFPAVSAGWVISKEDFFKVNNVDFLKIRGSYGESGNNRVSGTYYSLMSFGSYYFDSNTIGITASEGSPAFLNLKWETTKSLNGGLDFSMYNGLISGSLDVYHKITDDILLPSPVAGTVGTYRLGPDINAGSVRNNGVELVLNYQDKIGDFHYNVSFNGAYNKSKILKLTSAFSPYATDYRVGDQLGTVYGYVANGIFKSPDQAQSYLTNTVTSGLSPQTTAGDIIYKDVNGDKSLDYKDVVPIAETIPKYTYGLRLGASWKRLDLQLFLQGVADVQGYYQNDLFGNYAWIPKEALNSYTPSNPNGNYPRPLLYGTGTYSQNFSTASSFWVYNAAYLRVKNVQIGYNLPVSPNKVFQSARVYIVATNLLTWDHYRAGFDPESPTGTVIPTLKTFSVGLNVKF